MLFKLLRSPQIALEPRYSPVCNLLTTNGSILLKNIREFGFLCTSAKRVWVDDLQKDKDY